MQKSFRCFVVACAFLCFSGSLVVAEELQDMSLNDLLNMKVTVASKQSESISDAAAVVSVVTAQDIKAFGSTNLHDLLNRVVGIFSPTSFYQRNHETSIRGYLENLPVETTVLLLMNGRPVRGGDSGGYNNAFYMSFPISLIDHIEVIRGPGSVLYGTNAYVGVINVVTKAAAKELTGNVSAGAGSYSTTLGSVDIEKQMGEVSISAAAQFFNSSGWQFSEKDEANKKDSRAVGDIWNGLATQVAYKNLSINMFLAKGGWGLNNTNDTWIFAPKTVTNWSDTNRYFLDAGYKINISPSWYSTLNFTWNYDWSSVQNTVSGKHQTSDYLYEGTVFGKMFDEKLDVVAGAVVNNMTETDPLELQGGVTTYVTPDYNQTHTSVYAQGTYSLTSALKAILGAQYVKPDGSDGVAVPRAGLVYDKNGYGAKVLYGEAFRQAYPLETISNSTTLVGGNLVKLNGVQLTLTPEKVATYDVQVSRTTKDWQVALTYFSSDYTNRITKIPAKILDTRPTFMNVGELKQQGFELEGKVYPMSQLYVLGSYSFQWNEDSFGIKNVTFIPDSIAKLGFSYDNQKGVTIGIFDSYYSAPNRISDVVPLQTRALINQLNIVGATVASVSEANPEANAYNWLTAELTFNISKLAGMSYKGLSLSIYGVNLLNEQVYIPEFSRAAVDTIPTASGASVYAQVNCKF